MEYCRIVLHALIVILVILSTKGQLQPFCELPAERGPCNKLELRYRFSEESEYCQTFLYGGCEGNRNNFKTIEECVKTCVDEPVPNCELPKDPGSCFQTNKVRYFFDENTERCEKFYFSGCQGNKNNFETEEECRTTCGALPPLATESPKSASNGNNGWVNPTSIPSGINGFTLVDNNPNAPSPKQGDEGWKNSNNNNVNNNNNNNNNNNQNSNGNENLSGGFNRSWQSSSLSTTAQSKTWAQNLRQRWNDSINGRSPGDTPGNSGWNTSSNPKQANNSWNSNNAGGNNQSNNQWNSNNNASYQNKNGWNNWNNVSNNNNKSWNTQQRTKWNSNNSNNNWKNNQQNGWNSKPGWNSWNNKGTDNKNGNAGQSTGNRQTGIITNIWNPISKGPSNVQNTWNKNGNSNQKNTWNQNQQSQWNNNKWQSMKAQGNKWQGSSVGGDANKVGLSNSQPNQKVSNSNNQNQPMGRRSWHSNNSQNNNKWQSGNKNQAQNQQWNSNNKGWSKNPTPGVGNQHTSNNKARSPVSNTANSWQKMQHEQNQKGNAKDKPTLPPVQFIGNVGMQRTIVQRNTMTNGKAFNLKEAPVAKEMLHGVHKASQYPPGNSNAFSRRNSFVPPPNQHQANHQTQNSQFNSFGGGSGPKRWHSMKNAGNSWNVNTHHSKNSNNMGKFDANQNKHSFVSGQNQNWRGNGLSQQTNTANYQQNNQNNEFKNNVGANNQHQYQTNNNFKSWRSNQQASPNHSNPPGHPPVTNQWNQNNPGNQNPSGTQWNPNHSNAVKHPQGITQWNSNSPNTGQPLNKPQGITQWNSNRPNTGQPLNQPQGNNQWNSKTQNPSNPSNKQSVHRQWNSNNQNQNNYMKHNTGHNQWQINNQNPRNAAKHSTGQNQWNNNQKNSGKPAQPPSGHDKWNHNAQSPSSNANHQTGHNKWKSEIPNQRSPVNQPPPPSSKWNTNPNPSNSLKHPPEKNQWKSNNPNTFKSAQKPQQPPGRNKWNGNKPNQNWSSLKTPSGNDKMNSQNLGSSSKPSPENVKWNKNSQKDWSNKPHQSNQQNMQGNTRNLNSWSKKAPNHSQMNSTTHFHSQNSSVPQNFARQGPSNLNSNQMKNPSPRQPYNQWNTNKHGNNYKLKNQGIPNSVMKNPNGFSKEAITRGNRQSPNWNQNKDGVNTIQKQSNVSKGWNSQVRNNSLDQQTLPKDSNWGGNTWNRRPAENPTMLPGVAQKGQNSMTISHMSDIKKFPDSTPDPVLNWKTPESSGFDRFHPEVLTSKMDVRRTKIKASEKVKPTQTVDGNGAFVLPMSGSSNKEGTHPSPKPTVVIHAVDICLQGKNVGRCKGYEPSYYHNKETKQCELFIYSGCGGNSNLFYSRADCEQTCHVERLPVCEQPRDTGTCAAHRVKYFYNKATKSCEEFTYTGCEGNDNRFDSMEQCEATCTFKTLCELPKDVGPCQRWEPRYWYNPSKKECEVFYFGGCHGNKNNFRDITTCRKHCVSRLR